MAHSRVCLAWLLPCALAACTSVQAPSRPLHEAYWKERASYEALFEPQVVTDATLLEEGISGVILPHHLFVGHEMARLYRALQNQKPSVVIIVGPNHFYHGRGAIQVTDTGFRTPYGDTAIHADIVDALLRARVASLEPETFDAEHSISAHVAFVRRTFPDVPIVPIVLKPGTPEGAVAALSDALADVLPADALVLASVDFSHYLPPEVAAFHDDYARAVITQGAIDHVRRLEIDSPESIRVLMDILTRRGARRIVYERHTNSADFIHGHPPDETTSHFFVAFAEGEPPSFPFATVQFFGDTIAGRGIADAVARGFDPLGDIRGKEDRFFRGVTITGVNLEGPITAATLDERKTVSFGFDRTIAISLLRTMNVQVAGIANNHIDDAGVRGKIDTVDALKSEGIVLAGYRDPCARTPIVGGTMAVCAFADQAETLDAEKVAAVIREARETSDYVVVSVHWGREYEATPSAAQRRLAEAFIRAGADAVIGHGPHVRGKVERIDGKPVLYSIGNFLFDQPDSQLSSGLVAGLTFSPEGIAVRTFPVRTAGGKPRLEKQ